MAGFLALAVGCFFLWKFDKAIDKDNELLAAVYLLVGMAVIFVLSDIFL